MKRGFLFAATEIRIHPARNEIKRHLAILTLFGLSLNVAIAQQPLKGIRPTPIFLDSGGIFTSVDYLYWKPRSNGMDFAVSDPNNDNNIEGPTEQIQPEGGSGVRASIGYLTDTGWDVMFTYTHFGSHSTRAISAPPGGQLWLTRTNPASGNNFAFNATGATSVDYDTYDLEAGYWLYPTSSTAIRLFGGIRGATIDEQMIMSYSGGSIVNGTREQTQSTDLNGVGLRTGAEGHWNVFGNISLFASAATSVLVADITTNYIENEPLGPGKVNISTEYFQTVPVMEVACGINAQIGCVNIQAGYELNSWLNVDPRTNFTGSQNMMRGGQTTVANDLGLDGLFARLITIW